MRLFSGQSAWLLQRASAILVLLLLLLGIVNLLAAPPGYEAWRALATSTHGAVLIIVGFIAVAVHAWIGTRDVVLDYVHVPALRIVILAVVGTLLLGVLTRVVLTVATALAAT